MRLREDGAHVEQGPASHGHTRLGDGPAGPSVVVLGCEDHDRPATVGLQHVPELHRLGVGQPDHRRGVEAHAHDQTARQRLILVAAGDHRRVVAGLDARRVPTVLLEVLLEAGRVGLGHRSLAEQAGHVLVELDQLDGLGVTLGGVGVEQ